MGRRKANLDYEYKLEREIEDLKAQIAKLKKQLRENEKSATKKEAPAEKKPVKKVAKECPKCGASVKETELPHAYLELCSVACGFREVKKK